MILRNVLFFFLLMNISKLNVIGKSVRIIGGESTDIRQFPFMASIRTKPFNYLICGGVIISQYHILSAAHCFFNKQELYSFLRIYIGTSSVSSPDAGSQFKIRHVILHPEFTGIMEMDTMNEYDISITQVEGTIIFNEFQNKVSLPTSNVVGGEFGLLLGWGATEYPGYDVPDMLQVAPMTILNNTFCQTIFQFTIYRNQICAFQGVNCGVCTGDSGGPLISDNKIVGIVSTSKPCATGVPDLYTRVYSHLDFIQMFTSH